MKALALYQHYIGRIAAALAVFCAVSVFLYGVFLLMAVAHAAQISDIEGETRSLTAKLSSAEARYLSETQALNPGTAAQLGLSKPAAVAIVYATLPAQLTFNR